MCDNATRSLLRMCSGCRSHFKYDILFVSLSGVCCSRLRHFACVTVQSRDAVTSVMVRQAREIAWVRRTDVDCALQKFWPCLQANKQQHSPEHITPRTHQNVHAYM